MQSLIRTTAFVRKEVVDVIRQPMLLLALVVGPFLILLAFGAGLRETDPPLDTALVVSSESEMRQEVQDFADDERERDRLEIDGIYESSAEVMTRLRDRDLDLVIVFPDEVTETIEAEEQAIIELHHNQIDPIEGQAINLFSRTAIAEINNQVLESVIANFQATVRESEERRAAEATGDEDVQELDRYLELEPGIVVSPFRGEIQTIAGGQIELTDFYAPAVLVVLLQHLTVTLLGLSVVRERLLGATELFRVSPLRVGEYLAGKYLSYLLLGGVVAAGLLLLLVFGLGTPMNGEWWHLAAVLCVLLLTSTALGLVLSLLANTDSQAVQYAMLVLLATIFLSGFLLSLERFVPLAQPLPWLLPATYGIDAVRDVMLRGSPLDLSVVGGLALYGLVFAVIGAVIARHKLRRTGA